MPGTGGAGSDIGAQAICSRISWPPPTSCPACDSITSVRISITVASCLLAGCGRHSRLEFGDPLFRFLQELALLEFLDQPFEVGKCLCRKIELQQRFAEIVVGAVATRVFGVVFEEWLQSSDRTGIPLDAKIVDGHANFPVGEAVLRLAQVLARLSDQRLVGEAGHVGLGLPGAGP